MSESLSAQTDPREATIPAESAGLRIDQVLARLFPEFSRSRLQEWIRQGRVSLEGRSPRPRDRVRGGERVVVRPRLEPRGDDAPEAIPLELIHEDPQVLVINKPPGLVVHPGAGNRRGTLLNALLYLAPELECLPRAGIVHRLDKDTSGVMVVARTLAAHTRLVAQLQARSMGREYLALVQGALVAGGTVEGDLGRHPVQRTRMAVVRGGRPAVTHYRIERRFRDHTLLRISLETGRTHQIRVHMAHIRHSVVGDPLYGGRLRLPAGAPDTVVQALRAFRRQALHAERLTLEHPHGGRPMSWRAPLPRDMQELLAALEGTA
jgi:23S rRNA pseudouridine1911/1915/1917 synthase